jgi:hypothetical protein
MGREQEPAGTAAQRTTTISGNSIKLLQTKPKKTNPILRQKTRHDPMMITESLSAKIPVCYLHF